MMEDRDFWMLYACFAGVGVCVLLHGKLISMIADQVTDLRTDVEFLKDHTVARETEARP
jgi:hypothetical protein